MSKIVFHALWLAVIGQAFRHGIAFGPLAAPLLAQSRTNVSLRMAKDTPSADDDKGESSLNLKGVVVRETSTLPGPGTKDIEDFFTDPEHMRLIVTGGGKRPSELVPVSQDLLESWVEASVEMGAQQPSQDDSIVRVQTGGISFPGVKVVSNVLIGAKILKETETTPMKYELVLIKDDRVVEGLPPVVWIYNQLTGSNVESGGSRKVKSLTTVTVSKLDNDSITFKVDALLNIYVKFPALLLRILPTSKEKAEETGGKSISKTLAEDVDLSFVAYESAYMRWLNPS